MQFEVVSATEPAQRGHPANVPGVAEENTANRVKGFEPEVSVLSGRTIPLAACPPAKLTPPVARGVVIGAYCTIVAFGIRV